MDTKSTITCSIKPSRLSPWCKNYRYVSYLISHYQAWLLQYFLSSLEHGYYTRLTCLNMLTTTYYTYMRRTHSYLRLLWVFDLLGPRLAWVTICFGVKQGHDLPGPRPHARIAPTRSTTPNLLENIPTCSKLVRHALIRPK